ncbi:MAG TPA: hypothetical protein VGM66_14605 [Candidatus Udaeobacter sp.]|jgi:hypothetical protein
MIAALKQAMATYRNDLRWPIGFISLLANHAKKFFHALTRRKLKQKKEQ